MGYNLLINGVYWGYTNFLGHPSTYCLLYKYILYAVFRLMPQSGVFPTGKQESSFQRPIHVEWISLLFSKGILQTGTLFPVAEFQFTKTKVHFSSSFGGWLTVAVHVVQEQINHGIDVYTCWLFFFCVCVCVCEWRVLCCYVMLRLWKLFPSVIYIYIYKIWLQKTPHKRKKVHGSSWLQGDINWLILLLWMFSCCGSSTHS